MRVIYFFFLASFIIGLNSGYGQNKFPHININYTNQEILIDGLDNEEAWQNAEIANDFWQHFPSDSIKAIEQTQFRILSSDTHLYVFVDAFSSQKNYRTPSLKRDFAGRGVDNITLVLDTFSDSTNGIYIGSNPFSVQREGQIANGGQNRYDFDNSWDIIWEVKSVQVEGKYTVEFKIPLSQIKFPEGEKTWRFNIYRYNTATYEWSTWSPIPQEMIPVNMAFMGTIEFDNPIEKSKTPIYIIPYVNSIVSKDYTDSNKSNSWVKNLNVGLDSKISISNGMNLDLTINPDFSQVEVDDEIVNLTRFEVSLPEKRQFFIQNEDLFSDYGNFRDSRPFFSRRIGIGENKDGENIENKIIGGLRLNGKLNPSTRLGFLNIQTTEDIENEIPSNNNTVFVLQKQVFGRSNLSLLLVNRETFKDYKFLSQDDRYNRILGLDYKLASSDNSWTGDFFYHQSFANNIEQDRSSFGARLSRQTRSLYFRLGGVYVGQEYRADLGFVRRTGVYRLFPAVGYTWYLKKSKINSISLRQNLFLTYQNNNGFESSDITHLTQSTIEFKDMSQIEFQYWNRYTYLYEPFDPTGNDNIDLPENSGYNYGYINLKYTSDFSRNFLFGIETELGQFYSGKKYSLESEFSLRVQPRFVSRLIVNLNHIDLPDPYPTETLVLVNTKFEFSFTRKLFWSTVLQFNTQGENFGINSRLQWRFAPLSDLYLVYNDNYKTNGAFDFDVESRSINLKLSYWLNI